MQNYLGVAVLCMIPGIISYCISMKTYRGVKIIAFYMGLYAGALSALKSLLHEGGLSIFESFKDIVPITYAHYIVPIFCLSVVVPFIIKAVLKERAVKFIYLADSFFFFLVGIAFLMLGRITNIFYCVILFLAIILAFAACCLNKEAVFIKKLKREDAALSILVIGFWVMTNLVFSTGELYLNNVVDFPVSFASLMLSVIFAGIIYIVLYTMGGYLFLTRRQHKLFYVVIAVLTFMEYVQGIFLNGHLETLEGIKQTWSSKVVFINGVIWFLVIAIAVWVFIKNNGILRLYKSACIYICFIQLVSLVYLGLTTDFSKKDEYALTTDGMLEVDDENNIIVFVLDFFDGQIFEWIEEEAPDFLEPLKDFTNYENTTSCYSYTAMAVPYMLSGVKYNNEDTLEEWYANAYTEESLLREIDKQDYDIGIYTAFQYMDQSLQDIVINYSNEVERRCRFSDSVALMLKCAGYKNMPFILKDRFTYSTEDIESLSVDGNKFMTNKDVWIYRDLTQKKLQAVDISDRKGAFRFLHFRGAHPPISMNEYLEDVDGKVELTHESWLSQAKGSLKIVYEYLEQMKQLGVYDNATIIITADHGQNKYMDNDDGKIYGFEDRTSNPIMLVKQSGISDKETMTISNAPTSHEELAASIVKAMGGNYTGFGRAFDEIETNENRVREFVYGRFGGAPFISYNICGDVRNIDDWSVAK